MGWVRWRIRIAVAMREECYAIAQRIASKIPRMEVIVWEINHLNSIRLLVLFNGEKKNSSFQILTKDITQGFSYLQFCYLCEFIYDNIFKISSYSSGSLTASAKIGSLRKTTMATCRKNRRNRYICQHGYIR